ncbi:MAG: hypothetical protein KH384_09120 [Corynebacteriales bacterium]|nr:hypothetical protein [Mycobacteriales bacterium]
MMQSEPESYGDLISQAARMGGTVGTPFRRSVSAPRLRSPRRPQVPVLRAPLKQTRKYRYPFHAGVSDTDQLAPIACRVNELVSTRLEPQRSDAVKAARTILLAASAQQPPSRLLLGSDAVAGLRTQTKVELAEVDAYEALGMSTDAD